MPLSKSGSLEYAEALVRQIALREGFGDLLAQGVEKAADAIGRGTRDKIGDLLHKAHQVDQYGGRTYIVNGLMYATEVRMPIQHLHKTSIPVMQWLGWVQRLEGAYVSGDVIRGIASRFYGSEAAADFSSYDGKAMAAKTVQDRQYAAECLVLCDYAWPVLTSFSTDDHVGDPSLESRFFSAVTGQEIDESWPRLASARWCSICRGPFWPAKATRAARATLCRSITSLLRSGSMFSIHRCWCPVRMATQFPGRG